MADTQNHRETVEKEMGGNFVEFPKIERELPQNFNLDRFPESDRQLAADIITATNSYIHAPLIIDKYSDHDERETDRFNIYDRIEKEMGTDAARDFNVVATYNKLKRNCNSNLSMTASLWQFISPNSKSAPEIRQIVEGIKAIRKFDEEKNETVVVDPWNEKALDEKKVILVRLTNLAIDMLEEIANK